MLRAMGAAILPAGRGSRPANSTGGDTMSATDENKAAVRGCLENASRGNFGALHDILAPEYVCHPEEARGVEGLTEMVEGYRNALAGLSVTVEHQFTEGDYVATRSTIRGRHAGELMGTPPTGRDVAFSMLTLSRCRDGRIEEEWEIADTVSLLGQIGALPQMAGA
jgi:predicted ester cyclase